MILPDINILIYAHNSADERFERASKWFQELMSGSEPACFCWETINGFIRISTNKHAVPDPFSLTEAFRAVESWLSQPNTVLLKPTGDHLNLLREVSFDANATGKLYSDAILAVYAISYNAVFASTDRDFRLFRGLKLIDPLAPK